MWDPVPCKNIGSSTTNLWTQGWGNMGKAPSCTKELADRKVACQMGGMMYNQDITMLKSRASETVANSATIIKLIYNINILH